MDCDFNDSEKSHRNMTRFIQDKFSTKRQEKYTFHRYH